MLKIIKTKIYSSLGDKNRERLSYFYLNYKKYRLYKIIFSRIKNLRGNVNWLILKNKKIKNLNLFEKRLYSQNGEDGIIQAILKKAGTKNKHCVEFGIHPLEGNTIYLSKKGWNCLWMDGAQTGPNIKKEYITAENINQLLKKYKLPKEFDVLSIDIDSNDYWIWKAIKNYSPRLVVIEYNGSIPQTESKTVKYDPKLSWDKTNYYGASLLALNKLAREKGYTLLCCDKSGNNAFFLRDDLVKNNFEIKTIEKLFKPRKNIYAESSRKMIEV